MVLDNETTYTTHCTYDRPAIKQTIHELIYESINELIVGDIPEAQASATLGVIPKAQASATLAIDSLLSVFDLTDQQIKNLAEVKNHYTNPATYGLTPASPLEITDILTQQLELLCKVTGTNGNPIWVS